MNVVVTGANGFIGKNLIEFLSAKDGYNTHALVRSIPSFPLKNIEYHLADLADFTTDKFAINNPDVVIHLAQSANYREFPDGAEDMFKINIESTFKLLEWCRAKKVKKFIFASTGSVYKSKDSLITESDPTSSIQFYPTTKIVAEQLIANYEAYFNIIILRIFTAYGPFQKAMLISNIIDKISSGNEITLAQNTGITLSPIYVDDLTSVLYQLLKSEVKSGIYNCGGKETVTLKKITEILEQKTGMVANVVNGNGKAGYIAADSGKLYKALNFSPGITINEGLQNIIDKQQLPGGN